MSREENKPKFIPWMLALALAAVLTWYVINPVPRVSHQRKLEDDLPETDRQQKQVRFDGPSHRFGMRSGILPAIIPSSTGDEDLPDWPEYIRVVAMG